ncbi:MAG: YraN family protein [Capsulimonas sp.]|uniref:YraN family protein n=1 Tax=Capsulimonas sp. TaxID=2494211 RepID=UPI003262E959
MGINRKTIGADGEADTIAFLEAHGYRMVDTNVRPFHDMRRGEIDLIGWHGEYLVFIEVKTRRARRDAAQITPSEAVNAPKRRQLLALAEAYLSLHQLNDIPCRFDVVEVIRLRNGSARITIIPNAFTGDDA